MIIFLNSLITVFLINGILAYWLPLLALRRRAKHPPPELPSAPGVPYLEVLIPCHNGAQSLPGLLKCLALQTYPRDRYRVTVLLDNCTDDSAAVARSYGAHSYIRCDPQKAGKSHALNHILTEFYRNRPFSALVLFDVDSRLGPDFLTGLGTHLDGGPAVLQGAGYPKNPGENALTRLGDLGQVLIRVHQRGCVALGVQPILMGGFGVTLTRETLARLNWRVGDDFAADDLELQLRCGLLAIPIKYIPDLKVFHELPDQAGELYRQRRRWIGYTLRLAPRYVPAYLRRALRGDRIAWGVLMGMLFCPAFSLLLSYLLIATLLCGLLSRWNASFVPWALADTVLSLTYLGYFFAAFHLENVRLGFRDVIAAPRYLLLRLYAAFQGCLYAASTRASTARHKSDADLGFSVDGPPPSGGAA